MSTPDPYGPPDDRSGPDLSKAGDSSTSGVPPRGGYGQTSPQGRVYGPPQGGGYGPPQGGGMQYFAFVNGAERGPLSPADCQRLAAEGTLQGDTIVRTASGAQLPAKQIPGAFSHREWLTTLLLSIFVGSVGVDRFYVGQTGLGVAKLLTCGGCGIWHIIDIILIAMRKFLDVDGRALS